MGTVNSGIDINSLLQPADQDIQTSIENFVGDMSGISIIKIITDIISQILGSIVSVFMILFTLVFYIRLKQESQPKKVSKEKIYVATESELILEHCKKNNIQVVLTSDDCLTGTDRIAEFSKQVSADYYINVQGDEPLINPDDILKIYNGVKENEGKILNGYCAIDNIETFKSSGMPKVVFREDKRLLYMSRAGIPLSKTGNYSFGYRQVCVYAFPKNALDDFASRNNKTQFEEVEDIEILRFLEMGYDVQMVELSKDSIPVDYKEDIDKVLKILNEANR